MQWLYMIVQQYNIFGSRTDIDGTDAEFIHFIELPVFQILLLQLDA